MKVIHINVNEKTFNKLQRGDLTIDIRLDELHKGIKHDIGDMIVYSMLDREGNQVEDKNLAFIVATKIDMESFVERIGEQMMRKDPRSADDLVIITLEPIGVGHKRRPFSHPPDSPS